MKNQKENIAIAIPNLKMGGAERVVCELANDFTAMGYHITIVLLDSPEIYYKLNSNITTYFIEYNKNKNTFFRNIERVNKFRKFIKENSINIVLSFLTSSNFLSILATRGIKVQTYISERSDPNKDTKKIKRIRNILYSFSDGLICQTEEAMNYFPSIIRNKGIVIKNPIKENLPKWREINEHDRNIVTAVRLNKAKNIPMLIDAFSKVQSQYQDYKLLIYGDGEERDNIKQKIEDYGLEKSIILKGKNNQWHEEAKYASMFVLSSDYEGMSNSLLEAMAMGMPVISTNHPVGGAREVIENGKNGFLVPVGDSDELADKIKKIIENKELQLQFSEKAEEILKVLNRKKIIKQWLDFLINTKE